MINKQGGNDISAINLRSARMEFYGIWYKAGNANRGGGVFLVYPLSEKKIENTPYQNIGKNYLKTWKT